LEKHSLSDWKHKTFTLFFTTALHKHFINIICVKYFTKGQLYLFARYQYTYKFVSSNFNQLKINVYNVQFTKIFICFQEKNSYIDISAVI